MVFNGKTPNNPTDRSDDFWTYVPDPARTVFYLLLGVVAVVASEWVPQLAAQMEQTRIQQRMWETKDRELAAYEAWRQQYPHYYHLVEAMKEQEIAQAEREAAAEFQLAQPSAPMSPMSNEATTPVTWN